MSRSTINLSPFFLLALLAVTAFVALSSAPAHAVTMYGALSNFDAINDTGSEAHGFEIELDGCLPSNVFGTFGGPYNRYGNPTITTDGVNTFVRYEAKYSGGAWDVGTVSGTLADTGGHSLFSGYPGYPGTVPGDHFGVALNINPTNTIYHWLLDSGLGNGTLVLAGTSVKIPAPVFVVVPPANPVNPAGVQAVLQAPPPEVGQQFGDAIWAKVFTTVVEHPNRVELNELVLGNAVVPPDTETEVEWQLLQAGKAGFGERGDNDDLGAGNEAMTRRYEFYRYKGDYDLESHEALTDTYDPALVGDYLGNQNAAANFVPFAPRPGGVPEPGTAGAVAIALLCATGFMLRRRGAA